MEKNKHKLPVFIFLFLCGIAFAIWSMLIPPGGVIDSSVLVFIAQIFILAASVYGFEVHFDIKEGQFHAGRHHDVLIRHRMEEPEEYIDS